MLDLASGLKCSLAGRLCLLFFRTLFSESHLATPCNLSEVKLGGELATYVAAPNRLTPRDVNVPLTKAQSARRSSPPTLNQTPRQTPDATTDCRLTPRNPPYRGRSLFSVTRRVRDASKPSGQRSGGSVCRDSHTMWTHIPGLCSSPGGRHPCHACSVLQISLESSSV